MVIVENPVLDIKTVDFYVTTTLWCHSLNTMLDVMVPNHEFKVRRYGTDTIA